MPERRAFVRQFSGDEPKLAMELHLLSRAPRVLMLRQVSLSRLPRCHSGPWTSDDLGAEEESSPTSAPPFPASTARVRMRPDGHRKWRAIQGLVPDILRARACGGRRVSMTFSEAALARGKRGVLHPIVTQETDSLVEHRHPADPSNRAKARISHAPVKPTSVLPPTSQTRSGLRVRRCSPPPRATA